MDPALLNLTIRRGITWPGVAITCNDAAGEPVALAGWSALAEIRDPEDGGLLHDLAPVIAADDADGLITLPEIPWETTAELAEGDYTYDVIPVDTAGKRLDPILAGNVRVVTPTTGGLQ